jgi:hypothetical protein
MLPGLRASLGDRTLCGVIAEALGEHGPLVGRKNEYRDLHEVRQVSGAPARHTRVKIPPVMSFLASNVSLRNASPNA